MYQSSYTEQLLKVVYVEFFQCVLYNKPSCSLALCEQLSYQMIQFVVFTAVSGQRELDVDVDVYSDGQECVTSY